MKKLILGLMILGIILGSAFPILSAAGLYDKYLTVADVEKVTGRSGVKILISNNQSAADDEVIFTTSDSKWLLTARYMAVRYLKDFKEDPAYIKAPVAGVGEEAYTGPKNVRNI